MKRALLIFVVLVLLGGGYYLLNKGTKSESFTFQTEGGTAVEVGVTKGNIIFNSSYKKEVAGKIRFTGVSPSTQLTKNVIAINGIASSVKDVRLTVPTENEIPSIKISVGAGNITLPLQDVVVKEVAINAGASNVELTLPENVSSTVNISVGAGNINVEVPMKGKLGGVKIIPAAGVTFEEGQLTGFEKIDDYYQSLEFDQNGVISTINLSAGAANFNIKSAQ